MLKGLSGGVPSNSPNPITVDGTGLQNEARFVGFPETAVPTAVPGDRALGWTGCWCGPDVLSYIIP